MPRHNHLPSVFLTDGVLLVVDEISGLSPLMLMTKAARLKKGEKLFVRGESGKRRESKEKHLEGCTGCYPPPRRGYFERNRTGRRRRKKKEEKSKNPVITTRGTCSSRGMEQVFWEKGQLRWRWMRLVSWRERKCQGSFAATAGFMIYGENTLIEGGKKSTGGSWMGPF